MSTHLSSTTIAIGGGALLVLGIPALFAGIALAQLMPVTTVHNGRKGGKR